MLSAKHLVHAAVAFPQNHLALFYRSVFVAPKLQLEWIPDRHLAFGDAHFQRGVAAEMLIGKKEHALATLECPLQHSLCIAAGANDPAVLATKRF